MAERLGRDGTLRKQIHVWLDTEAIERLDKLAQRRRWERRDVIEEAIERLYEDEFPALVTDSDGDGERVA